MTDQFNVRTCPWALFALLFSALLFSNLSFAMPPGASPIVLYEFEEGSGSVVLDTASVGAPLDLTIEDSNAISWISGGLSIDAPTVIQSATSAAC